GESQLVAELDYHGPQVAAHRKHTAYLQFEHSPEWKAWTGLDRTWQNQVAFAQFLEDRIRNISEPAGAQIVEACDRLVAKKDVAFRSILNRKDGSSSFEYVEEVRQEKVEGTLQVPDRFILALRPYSHSEPVAVEVRLRYDITGGKLKFQYALD